MHGIIESHIEEAALTWLSDLHYSVIFGPEIAPGEARAERSSYHEYILQRRLNHAIRKLNTSIPSDALDDAFRKVTIPTSPSLAINNRNFHKMLVEGVEVEYQRPDGSIAGNRVKLADFENPENNDWLAVNQFT
ncbi:MAG: type I restriction endonuclease, partial [Methanomicrobiales archaeon]|nr:type I restriction endonuclease [Methanomicrobiales archaeon]